MRNTVWLTLFVLVGLTWAAPVWAQVCVPPPSGIVSWWPAEGNANDIIGPNSGLLQGGATFGPGKVGQAFSFNGVTAYVDLGANPSLNRPGDFTVEGWVNVQTFALDNKYIFADFDSGGNTSQGSLRIRAAGGAAAIIVLVGISPPQMGLTKTLRAPRRETLISGITLQWFETTPLSL